LKALNEHRDWRRQVLHAVPTSPRSALLTGDVGVKPAR